MSSVIALLFVLSHHPEINYSPVPDLQVQIQYAPQPYIPPPLPCNLRGTCDPPPTIYQQPRQSYCTTDCWPDGTHCVRRCQ
jgi:hypothetical protein